MPRCFSSRRTSSIRIPDRVDRDIDRLLRRVTPGDIVVLDALDLDRVTADALVQAGVAAVGQASPALPGRYPNLGPEVLGANGLTLVAQP